MRPIAGRSEVGLPVLLFALFGGAVAWSLHLLVSYFLVALFCTAGWAGLGPALAAATAVFAAAAGAAGVTAYRAWRRVRTPRAWDVALSRPDGPAGIFLVMGVLASGVFLVIIILAGLPPLFLPACV